MDDKFQWKGPNEVKWWHAVIHHHQFWMFFVCFFRLLLGNKKTSQCDQFKKWNAPHLDGNPRKSHHLRHGILQVWRSAVRPSLHLHFKSGKSFLHGRRWTRCDDSEVNNYQHTKWFHRDPFEDNSSWRQNFRFSSNRTKVWKWIDVEKILEIISQLTMQIFK